MYGANTVSQHLCLFRLTSSKPVPWGGHHHAPFVKEGTEPQENKITFSRHQDGNGQSRIWIEDSLILKFMLFPPRQASIYLFWLFLGHVSLCISQVSHATLWAKQIEKQKNLKNNKNVCQTKKEHVIFLTVKFTSFFEINRTFSLFNTCSFSFQIVPL